MFSLTVGRNEAGAQRRVGGERTNSSVGGISHPAVRGMGADAAGLPAQADGRAKEVYLMRVPLLLVHGGAGTKTMSEERHRAYVESLKRILEQAYPVLA